MTSSIPDRHAPSPKPVSRLASDGLYSGTTLAGRDIYLANTIWINATDFSYNRHAPDGAQAPRKGNNAFIADNIFLNLGDSVEDGHAPPPYSAPLGAPAKNPSQDDKPQSIGTRPVKSLDAVEKPDVKRVRCSQPPRHQESAAVTEGSVQRLEFRCPFCDRNYSNQKQLKYHQLDNSAHCTVHRKCFAEDEMCAHARAYRHDRCFSDSCHSKYRKEGGWSNKRIIAHITEDYGWLPAKLSV